MAHAPIVSKDMFARFTHFLPYWYNSGRTLLGGIVSANGNSQSLLTERETKWPLPLRGQILYAWPTAIVYYTGSALALQWSIF